MHPRFKVALLAMAISASLAGCDHPFESSSARDDREATEANDALKADMARLIAQRAAQQEAADAREHEMHRQVINDNIRQWNMLRTDDRAGRCVHANLLAEVYLQAHNASEYSDWKTTAKKYCPPGM